jgi:hypothetical protein
VFDKYEKRKEEFNEQMEEKYPKVAKGLNYFAEVWAETFPDPDKKMRDKRSRR